MEIVLKNGILLLLCAIILLTGSCNKDEDLKGKPLLTTTQVNGITPTTASCGGNIADDGGAPVTARGVVWSTTPDPTIATNQGITSDSIGTGLFTSNLTGLAPATTYYVRAYATNSVGTTYGNQQTFETMSGFITLTTTAVNGITTTRAVSGGNIDSDGGTPVIARGVVWSTTPDPTIATNHGITSDSTGTGPFISNLIDLTLSTTYYVRAYATNSVGTTYGNQQTFTTLNGVITLTTTAVTNLTITTAVSGGNIDSDGGAPVTARGVVWSTSPDPTIATNQGITSDSTGTGPFISSLTDLTLSTTYYVRAYATNSVGTTYGNQQTFETMSGFITLTTTAVKNLTITTAVSGGNIDSDGGASVTVRGVVWSTTPDPTIATNQGITSDSTGIGRFISSLTDLTLSTTYYVRAYATNSVGTTYGNQQTFTTLNGVITLTTTAVTSLTITTAVSGGNIYSDGGASVTARGVVWNTTPNPTTFTNQGITIDSTGTGSFISSMTGLTPNTAYYVRAYATNSVGTQYGTQIVFSTPMPDGSGPIIIDIDGNTYNTIWINNRLWMKENLKTTRFRDGSSIPNITNGDDWVGLYTPAYCWYNNNIANKPLYGALYKWYTVQTGKLCPTGWHVPTDVEWSALINYVDSSINGANTIYSSGTILKATSGWMSGGNGTDDFGFTAIPGGMRDGYSRFYSLGRSGWWWSSTALDGSNAWRRIMSYDNMTVGRTYGYKSYGCSVRCIKDN